jgi:hypothetical protein
MIKEVVHSNNRQHVCTQLRITDNGVSVRGQPENVSSDPLNLSLSSDELLAIVPGTLRTKSGKNLIVTVVVEKGCAADGSERCHVFQLGDRYDGECLFEATKRMWETQLFRNLLGASPDEAHHGDLAAVIARDIAVAERRASELVAEAADPDGSWPNDVVVLHA